MRKRYVLIGSVAVLLLILAIAAFWLVQGASAPTETEIVDTPTSATTSSEVVTPKETTKKEPTETSSQNIKSPHFVSSSPANNTVLTEPVSEVTINFDFDLGVGSKIEVTVNGTSVVAQSAKISADKLSMTVLINPVTPGNYSVKYTACWPDGSCHPGSFGFSVVNE